MSKTAMVAKRETLADSPELAAAEAKAAETGRNSTGPQSRVAKCQVGISRRHRLRGRAIAYRQNRPRRRRATHQVKVAEAACNMAQAAYRQAFVQAGAALCEEHRPEYVELVEASNSPWPNSSTPCGRKMNSSSDSQRWASAPIFRDRVWKFTKTY